MSKEFQRLLDKHINTETVWKSSTERYQRFLSSKYAETV